MDLKNLKKYNNIIESNKNCQTFRAVVLGMSGSGKSTFLKGLLNLLFKDKKSIIICFTMPFNYLFYAGCCNIVYTNTNKDFILDKLDALLNDETIKKYKTYIIFDDVIDSALVDSDIFKRFVMTSRHQNINLIMLIQTYYEYLNRVLKENVTHYILFKMNENRIIRAICRDIIANIYDIEDNEDDNFKKALKLYKDEIINKQFNNILVDMVNQKIII
jgi:GTPase SAR1 family protein